MAKQGKVGIVTVLFNSGAVIEEFFDTLNQQTYTNFVLYAINNASPDNSLEKTIEISKKVNFQTIIFDEKENWGVAKGNNIGIRHALEDGCDYVLLSNNDTVLEPTAIESLLTGMLGLSATMAVPKIYFHGTDLIWAAGGKFDTLRCSTPHIGFMEPDCGQHDTPRMTDYAPTCFMLIDRHVFERVGLMDEAYFVYYDDSDFVWRALRGGVEKLAYIPQSRLWHKESTSTGGPMSDFTLNYTYRNKEYFIRKNFKFPGKQIALLFEFLHTLLRKPFILSKHQLRLVRQAEKQGRSMLEN